MRVLCSIVLSTICIGCIEPYEPNLNSSDLNMLVVDGSISADGTASVILNRSIDMNTSSLINPKESNASVTIKSSSGENYSLTESKPGIYTASNLNVNYSDSFTLHVKTSSGYQYKSDEVQIYSTPTIDSIYFAVGATGKTLEVRVDSYDPNTNSTGYYLLEGTETYEHRAKIYSGYKLVNGIAVDRTPEDAAYQCWSNVIVPSVAFTTNGLDQNRLASIPVAFIQQYSRKIAIRYSILIKERTISEAEYRFRTQIKQTTELTGNIYSVVPGVVVGNVRSIENPNEYVLGYFRAQDVKERRFFIEFDDLPGAFKLQLLQTCDTEQTCRSDKSTLEQPINCINIMTLGSSAVITAVIRNEQRQQVGVVFTSPECGDCRATGGTNVKPSFWE